MAKRLLLVRHARPVGSPAGRLIGATDLPLDAAGLAQARSLANVVRRFAPARCYSSPLLRCRATAAAVADSLEVRLDPDLREIDFGRWENRTFAEIAADEPELVDRWAAFDARFAFPGGENLGDFLERVHCAADRLAAEPAETVLAVTHGGVIRSLICRFLRLEPRQYLLFDVRYAGMVTLDLFEGRGVLAIEGPAESEAAHG